MKNFIKDLEKQDLFLVAKNGDLILRGRKGKLSAREIAVIKANKGIVTFIKENKEALIQYLGTETAEPTVYKLSPLQEGFLFHGLYDESSKAYTEQMTLDFPQGVDSDALELAWNYLLQNHSALRSVFFYDRLNIPVQSVRPNVTIPYTQIDHSSYTQKEQEEKFNLFLQEDVEKGFDFSVAPLMRVTLFKINESAYKMVWTHHHIILDGWSLPVLMMELLDAYDAFLQGVAPENKTEDRYEDYIKYINAQDKFEAEDFWKKYLTGFENPSLLPFVGNTVDRNKGGAKAQKIHLDFEADFTEKIKQFAQANLVTVNTLVQGIWSFLLSKYTGNKDTVFGVTVSGRPAELENAEQRVGLFINTLPLRSKIEEAQEVKDWLNTIQKEHTRAREFQYTALNDIQSWIDLKGDFFDSMLVFENYPIGEVLSKSWTLKIDNFQSKEQTNYLLTLVVGLEEKLSVKFIYNEGVLPEYFVQMIKGHFETCLRQIVSQEVQHFSEIDILTKGEKEQVLNTFNQTSVDYPQDQTLVDLFATAVKNTPKQIALNFAGTTLNYQQLDEQSNQFAQHLIHRGVEPNSIIAVCLHRSLDMVVAFLGIVKAGCAYIPIDPAYPKERINYILQDAQTKHIITNKENNTLFDHSDALTVILTDEAQAHPSKEAVAVDINADQPIYVIYTSGSTGHPKGVVVNHRSLTNLVHWHINAYELSTDSHATLMAGVGFDASVWELWPYLSVGATLFIVDEMHRLSVEALLGFYEQQNITHSFLPTVLVPGFVRLSRNRQLAMKYLLTGGDSLATTNIEGLSYILVNNYGPTENTVVATFHPLRAADKNNNPSIGKPIDNVTTVLLDSEGRLVPVGVAGELCIGGASLAQGYLHRPELTAEKFVANPFGQTGDRLYKTGDLACWLPDGNLAFIGRRDNQIQIRGYRVELGEIEAVLQSNDQITQAVVLAKKAANGSKELVAYLVGKTAINQAEITEYLRQQLPAYMVPSMLIELDEMPLTANGKLDKKALPEPDGASLLSGGYVAARNEMEAQLVEIWKQVLKREEVGIQNNFFDLGGHSLLVTRVVSSIRQQLSIAVNIKEIFTYPTIAALAAYLGGPQEQPLLPTITPQPRPDRIPLSFSQERLWFVDKMEGSAHYHMPIVLRFQGSFEVTSLEKAFQTVVDRHEILRTVYLEEEGLVAQHILDRGQWQLNHLDWNGSGETEDLKAHIEDYLHQSFDLSKDHLLRAQLIRISAAEHVLIMVTHHIATDGWSLPLFVQEILEAYSADQENRTPNLPELTVQYADYAIWQRNYLSGELMENKLQYWEEKLNNVEALDLPTDFPRAATQSKNGSRMQFMIAKETTDQLQHLAREQKVTMYMLLLSVFKMLLSRYSGQEDICIGSPVANRTQKEIEPLLGFFINTLVLRNQIDPNWTFEHWLSEVKNTVLEAFAHQEVPYEKIVDRVVKTRDLSRSPLAQIVFVLQNNTTTPDVEPNKLSVTHEPLEQQTSDYDLHFSVTEVQEGMTVDFSFCSDLYLPTTIERMMTHFQELLASVIANPNEAVGKLSMLSASEKDQLLSTFNAPPVAYPTEQTVLEIFAAQAQKTPNQTAITCKGRDLSYQELDKKSDDLARFLKKTYELQADDLVGIMLDRSEWWLISILGVMKAGAAYVPIDIEYPRERKAFIIQDTKMKAMIIESDQLFEVLDFNVSIFSIDLQLEEVTSVENDNSIAINTAKSQDLAYVIYTSGSTGNPKGVLVEHRHLAASSHARMAYYGDMEAMVLISSFAFDSSVAVIWGTLLTGGCLVLPRNEEIKDSVGIKAIFDSRAMDAILCVPSYYQFLLEEKLLDATSFKRVVVAGEQLSNKLVAHHYDTCPNTLLYNEYGPTECAVWSSVAQVKREDEVVTIGKPVNNMQAYVLNEYEQLVPAGHIGELCLGGVQVTRGYLNRPELTTEKFVDNSLSALSNSKIYKTGDLVRWLPSGDLEFIGRKDNQIKISGYRIELGEIENVMEKSSLVGQAVVVAKEDKHGNKRLVAYLTSNTDFDASVKEELRGYLRNQLPGYMVPALLIDLEEFPLTANGKIDKKGLPDPDLSMMGTAKYITPRNATEETLANIWKDILQIEKVGVLDNFFELGGHSLLAIRVASAVRKQLAVEITIIDLFRELTVAALAEFVDAKEKESWLPDLSVQERPAHIPLSFSQERLWFIDKLQGSQHYHVSTAMRFSGDLDRSILASAFRNLVNRHEVLRTVFKEEDGLIYQEVLEENQWNMTTVDLAGKEGAREELVRAAINEPFDLSKDHMLRASVVQLAEKEQILVIVIHHIASDGDSMAILVRELLELYQAEKLNRPSNLSDLPIQYADYAIWQRTYLEGEVLDQKLDYWQTQLNEVEPLNLPIDFTRPAVQSTKGSTIEFTFNKKVSQQIQDFSQREDVTLFMLLLAVFKVFLHRYSGQDDICVGSPIANRTQTEAEGLMGFFVNTLALRSDLSSDPSFRDFLQTVKATVVEAYSHQEVPFEKIVDRVEEGRDMSRTPLFQVLFALQNSLESPTIEIDNMVVSEEEHEHEYSKFDLTFNVNETPEGLHLTIEYCTDLFLPETVQQMAMHYERLLARATATPAERVSALPILNSGEEQNLREAFDLSWVDYPRTENLVSLFEAQAARNPEHIALSLGAQQLSYQQLNEQSNQLAHHLVNQGVEQGDLVVICIDRSVEMLVGILAILKTGGAYVPVDPAYPQDRIDYILQDTATKTIVTNGANQALFASLEEVAIVAIDEAWEQIAKNPKTGLSIAITPQDLAYVIYTSGTTGNPKGVLLEHENVVRLFYMDTPLFDFGAEDVWTLFHSFCFDFSVWEMYGALLFGGRLVIVPKETAKDPQAFSTLLQTEGVTVLNQTPTAFYVLQEQALQSNQDLSLRYVVFGGEALNPSLLSPWLSRYTDCKMINMYGITETTVHVTYKEIGVKEAEQSTSNIGLPIPTLSCYVLDKNHKISPAGVPGELYVGGAGVARGYLNRPELTAERFIPNPFDDGATRLYKTGDLAKWLAQGDLEYLGRMDDQVKIRGYRIELGEVENVLQAAPSVQQCVVLAKEDAAGTKRLVAYVVAENEFDKNQIQDYLKSQLPEHMIPAVIIELEEIPMTSSGKVNKKVLPDPDSMDYISNQFIAPRNETEEQVATVWKAVLGIDQLGVRDNFFNVGGDSIVLIRVMSQLKKMFAKDIQVSDFYQAPTVEALAQHFLSTSENENNYAAWQTEIENEIESIKETALNQLPDAENIADVYPMSDIQKGMVFAALINPELSIYHDQFVYELPINNIPVFEKAFTLLVDKHATLRTAFNLNDFSEEVQVIYKEVPVNIHSEDLSETNAEVQKSHIENYIVEERKQPFVIAEAPLWRTGIFKIDSEKIIVVFQFHHAILDGWSVASLNTELYNLYTTLQNDPAFIPAPLTADYKAAVVESLVEKKNESHYGFWKNELADFKRLSIFNEEDVSDYYQKKYEVKYLNQLKAKAKEEAVSLKTLFLGAYLFALNLLTYEDEITVGLVSSIRPTCEDGDKILGCFLNTIPFRFQFEEGSEMTWNNYFKALENKHQDLRSRDRLTLYEIAQATDEKTVDGNPFFDVLYNYVDFHVYNDVQEKPEENPSDNELDVASYESTNTYLDTSVSITGGVLNISYSLRKALKAKVSLQQFGAYYEAVLNCFLEKPNELVNNETILSQETKTQLIEGWNKAFTGHEFEKNAIDLFEAQVAKTPEKTALFFAGKAWTYRAINEYANQLAHGLSKTAKLEKGDSIGLFMERSEWSAIALLGIMKLGCVYVPIDTSLPASRLHFILENSATKVLVTNGNKVSHLVENKSISVFDVKNGKALSRKKKSNPAIKINGDDAAFIIYTSGSTGVPKGVEQTHRMLSNLIQWDVENSGLLKGQKHLQYSSFSFDSSLHDILYAMSTGGEVYLIEEDLRRDFWALKNYILTHKIETVSMPYSALKLIFEELGIEAFDGHHIQEIISTGEQLYISGTLRNFLEQNPEISIHNLYGPSETHVVTASKYRFADGVVPVDATIGAPINNTSIYILDKKKQLLPPGVEGELYIAGSNLALGYKLDTGKTQERFIQNPINAQEIVYKTGDLGMWLSEAPYAGEIKYNGRVDDQLKIRGYRVELGEIEAILQQCEAVSQSVVLARKDATNNYRLVAYIVPTDTFDKEEIQNHLQAELPEYMIPSLFVELEQLPLTLNGKVDKKALPDPDASTLVTNEYVAPRNELEEKLAQIWKDLLRVEQVGIHDNFFELGGHSLLATRVASAVRKEFATELPIKEIFNKPTIAGIASVFQNQNTTTLPAITAISNRPQNIPLSFAQERLWFIDRLEGSVHYHLPVVLRCRGALNVQVLEEAFQAIVQRHEVLRTAFVEEEGKVFQQILSAEDWQLQFTSKASVSNRTAIEELVVASIEKPFDLSQDYMMRVHVIQRSEEEYVLVMVTHHIASDGWSEGLFVGEMLELYRAKLENRPSNLPQLPIQYADFALWQRANLTEEVLAEKLDYWKDKLNDLEPLNLPTDFPRPSLQSLQGGNHIGVVDPALSHALKQLAQKEGVTMFMLLMAAFKILLHKYSGQTDISVGSPIAGRTQKEVESLIGFFINTLVLRSDLNDNPRFKDFLNQVKNTTLDAYAQQEVPFEKVVDKVVQKRDMSRSPLFQVMFVLQNNPETPVVELGGIEFSGEASDQGISKFDLTLTAAETKDGLQLGLEYCRDLFLPDTIERMLSHYQLILSAIVANPQAEIGALSMLDTAEEEQILARAQGALADFPLDKTMVDLLEAQAALTPDNIAIEFETEQISYRELHERANQLAHHLRNHGLKTEDIVPLCLDRSVEMMVGLLGILKAGGAYLPIDPEYPQDRIEYMLKDAAAQIVLTLSTNRPALAGLEEGLTVISLDTDWSTIAKESTAAIALDLKPENLMYVIYTSGSTGRPKGVMNQHSGLVNRLLWAQSEYQLNPQTDVVLQKTTISFDVSVWELFWPLITGVKLAIARPGGHKDSDYLKSIIEEKQVTTMHFVPSMLEVFLLDMVAGECNSLRQVLCSGEALKPSHVTSFKEKLKQATLHNLYGPTEAAIDVSSWTIPTGEVNKVLIGKPVANTRLYVLDRQGQLTAFGVPGELFLAGIQVARGYHNRPELTAERFIDDPFDQNGGKLYKTGDLVRWLPDGNIEYLGRLDHQVKIRGYRIELGEIEATLQQAEWVRSAIVLAKADAQGNQRLVAYIIPETSFDKALIQQYLLSRLPDYMVPAFFVELEEMPLTANGKIDRKALPNPDGSALTQAEYVAPRNEIEEKIAAIWKELLQVEQVGIHDNFFELGGHSLLATSVASLIRKEFGLNIPIRTFFQHKTIADFYNYLRVTKLLEEEESDKEFDLLVL